MDRRIYKWVLRLGVFILLNVLFMIFDGTRLVTNIDFGDFGNKVLQTEFYIERLSFYENHFFNIVIVFAGIHLVISTVYDVAGKIFVRK